MVLVSSGAIGVGLKRMDMAHRPKNLSGKQVRGLLMLLHLKVSYGPRSQPSSCTNVVLIGISRNRSREIDSIMGQSIQSVRAANCSSVTDKRRYLRRKSTSHADLRAYNLRLDLQS